MATRGFASPRLLGPQTGSSPRHGLLGNCCEWRLSVCCGQRSCCGSKTGGLRESGGAGEGSEGEGRERTAGLGLRTAWLESFSKSGRDLPRLPWRRGDQAAVSPPSSWGAERGRRKARWGFQLLWGTFHPLCSPRPSRSPSSSPSPIGRFCSVSRPWSLAESSGTPFGRRSEGAGLPWGLPGLVVSLDGGGSAVPRRL